MKKFYLFFIFCFTVISVFAQENLFFLEGAQSSVYAKYIGGEEILNKNSSLFLNPASTEKLFTTAAVLDALGPDYTFETKIYFSGKRKGKKLKGDIYIVGGGDPTLASKYSNKTLEQLILSWIEEFKKQGITKITGNIYADNTLFKDNSLPIYTTYQNIGNYFAAPADALTIKDNNFSIYFEPSLEEGSFGKIAEIFPKEYPVDIVVKAYHTSEVSREDTYLDFIALEEKMLISGPLPLTEQKTEVLGSMAKPALFAAQYFKAKLAENEIKIGGEAKLGSKDDYTQDTLILTNFSAPLKEIIQKTNKKSINLYADILFRHLGKGSTKEALLAVKEYLARLGIDDYFVKFYDGSGLSRLNLTNCKTIVNLLEAVSKQPYAQEFMDSLPIVGDKEDIGSMSSRMQETIIAGKARVKTGTLDGVRAHAGYLQDKQERQIAFCIISNNFDIPREEIDSLHDEIILNLASLNKTDKHKNKK